MNQTKRDDFIVLRRVPQTGGAARGDFESIDRSTDSLAIDVVELADGEAAEIAHDEGVIGVARSCPVRLIEPVASGPASNDATARPGQSASYTWGIEAVGALDSSYDGAGVKVAVLDSGIDQSHPAFAGMTLTTENFTGGDNGDDIVGHGTHCAATIFGGSVEGKRIGVAPGVTEALVGKVVPDGGPGSTKVVFDALIWALRQGAHIISLSIGIDFPGLVASLQQRYPDHDSRIHISKALEDYHNTVMACTTIIEFVGQWHQFQQPALVLAASGNESDRRSDPPIVLGAAPPAATGGIVAVGAVGQPAADRPGGGFTIAPFSNGNPAVVAPGVEVISARAGGGLSTCSGTSMACPHAAGVAALWAEHLRSERGRYTPADLERLLLSSADRGAIAGKATIGDAGNGLVKAPPA